MCHPSHYIKVKQHVKIKPLLPIKQKKTPMLPLIPCASFFFSLLLKFTSDRYSERFCFERTDLSSLFNKIYVYFRSSTKHLLIEERPGPEGSIKHFMTIKTIQAEKEPIIMSHAVEHKCLEIICQKIKSDVHLLNNHP